MSDQRLETKSFGAFEIKDADKGEVEAVVATLSVVDKDGDVLLPDSFPTAAPVLLSDYRHSVILERARNVGKGVVSVKGTEAIFQGKFFVGMEDGRDAFEWVKGMGDDGEWSFGFPKPETTGMVTKEWQTKGAKRLITKITPVEVTPVLRGAGVNTRTLVAKHQKAKPEPNKLRCMNCSYFIGESTEPLVFVGKAVSHAEAEIKAALPRDIRLCKGCRWFNVYIPASALTGVLS